MTHTQLSFGNRMQSLGSGIGARGFLEERTRYQAEPHNERYRRRLCSSRRAPCPPRSKTCRARLMALCNSHGRDRFWLKGAVILYEGSASTARGWRNRTRDRGPELSLSLFSPRSAGMSERLALRGVSIYGGDKRTPPESLAFVQTPASTIVPAGTADPSRASGGTET